jgi:hypothetical protein
VEYTCKEAQGAALELKSPSQSEGIYDDLRLRAHILKYHEQWHAYARDIVHHRVSPDAIWLVSGWTKTFPDWKATAFSNFHAKHQTQLGVQAGGAAGADAHYGRSTAVSGPHLRRQGPLYSDMSTSTSSTERDMNQCAFVKSYRVKRRFGLVRELVAGAGPYEPPGSGDRRSAGYGEGVEAGDRGSFEADEDTFSVFAEQWVSCT